MANDAANNLTYFLLLEEDQKSFLGGIRNWDNLKVGFNEQGIWVKDFDYAQIQAIEVKTIPHKKVFYEKNGRLFPLDSLLPEGIVPSVIWTSIERALPVTLPSLNHNYFGLDDSLVIRLVPAENEKESVAMIVDLDLLGAYLEYSSTVRLKNLSWCILNDYTACIVGTPLLSIKGAVFWQQGVFLLPAGFDFELHSIKEELGKVLEVTGRDRMVWLENGSYFKLSYSDLQPLSLASFRMNIQNSIY